MSIEGEAPKEPGMFGYRPWTTTYKGKDIAMEIRPLKTKEMAIVLPISKMMADKWKTLNPDQQKSEKPMIRFEDPGDIEKMFDMQGKAGEILPNACRNLTGITEGHGWKEISEEFYYMSLAIAILMKLISISIVGEEDTKN